MNEPRRLLNRISSSVARYTRRKFKNKRQLTAMRSVDLTKEQHHSDGTESGSSGSSYENEFVIFRQEIGQRKMMREVSKMTSFLQL